MVSGDEHGALKPLSLGASKTEKSRQYEEVLARISALLQDEDEWGAAMATTVCELHHAFEYYDWTGFYTVSLKQPATLVIGPYQGHLGCLRIAFSRGVCGAAARERKTQLVPDVTAFPGYIACSSGTQSEIVVPVIHEGSQALMAVLDSDSDSPAAFDEVDQRYLEQLCRTLGDKYGLEWATTAQLQQLKR